MVTFIEVASVFLQNSWSFFTTLKVPLIDITFAQFYLGLAVIGLSITVYKFLFGFAVGYTKNTVSRNMRISEKRKKDTK